MAQFLFQPWDMLTSKDETFQVFSIRCLKCFNINFIQIIAEYCSSGCDCKKPSNLIGCAN